MTFDRETQLSVATLCVVMVATLLSILTCPCQARKRTQRGGLYEDADGKATQESMTAFSQKSPKRASLVLSTLGLALSLSFSVLVSASPRHHSSTSVGWIVTGISTLLLLQSLSLYTQRSPVTSHSLGIRLFGSCIVAVLSTIIQVIAFYLPLSNQDRITLGLRITHCGLTLFLGITGILLPRRPTIYRDGREVDAHFTITALSRFTWSWARPYLDLASKKGDLNHADIPEADHNLRAASLVQEWSSYHFKGGLLSSLLWLYKGRIAIQWTLTLLRCALGLGPFYIMLRLLQSLEQRAAGTPPDRDLWTLAMLFGTLSLTETWLDGCVSWLTFYGLAYPLRGQVAALIFQKSLRRKNVVTAGSSNENTGTEASQESGQQSKSKKQIESSSLLKSRQAVVNLVGVDARRISTFAMMQFQIINSVGKLIFYSSFLVNLIGWIPFLVGIGSWALITPVNAYASRYYMRVSEGLMKTRDQKLAVINEALQGMRQIKFSALEVEWERRIWTWRDKEIRQIRKVFIGDTLMFMCWVLSPILLAATSLSTYAWLHSGLTPSVAFVSISIFKGLEVALSVLPEFLTSGMDTLVSMRRIDTYLCGTEIEKIVTQADHISFDNATIAWPEDEGAVNGAKKRYTLKTLNLSFPTGELSVISGKTGTGKTLLLNALLGEVDLLEGFIRMPHNEKLSLHHDATVHPGDWITSGSVAYVSQVPWLESSSLRNNILFGLPFFEDRYEKVIDVCALKKDLTALPDGDRTELGANGINLSGGQKWRVTLARAVYSRAEILIMDDIFSAVDAYVGRQIFDNCIAGHLCQGRTRILVTHHIGLVQPKARYVVELGEGSVLHCGSATDLAQDGTLKQIRVTEEDEIATPGEESAALCSQEASKTVKVGDNERSRGGDRRNGNGTGTGTSSHMVASKDTEAAKKFIEEEGRKKGVVKRHVYTTYIRASGGVILWAICILSFCAFEAGNIGRNWWVRIWTGETQRYGSSSLATAAAPSMFGNAFSSNPQHVMSPSTPIVTAKTSTLSYYLWVYILISLVAGLLGTLRFICAFYLSLQASKTLFKRVIFVVLRTPLRWVDTVPVGRILNRLTADFDIIDNRLAMSLSMLLWYLLGLVGVCVAALLVTVYILPVALILTLLAGLVGKKYLDGARPVKRLESTSVSPVFETFNTALSGLATIRSYQKISAYTNRMYKDLDQWNITSVYIWLMNRWMGFRLAVIGTAFTTSVCVFVITSPSITAALGGFIMAFATDFASYILIGIRSYSNVELNMNAAERVIEYSDLVMESGDGNEPPAAWPTSGRIEVENLTVAYADNLPPTLKEISFTVHDNERIGIVGRTGAGKSSLTLALFRFLEARSGKVIIDGLDASAIKLHNLRSRLAIVPQDPVLFTGTVRSNLDPFNVRTDEELREALVRVKLAPSEPALSLDGTSGSQFDLLHFIAESGSNLSQGQRQLLCLARAIVTRPKIMVLDEATSSIDLAMDVLIQRSIREEFSDSTLLVIAHRLSTVADFDRILVLDDGRVAEFDTPRELWEKRGIFWGLCQSSGEKDALKNTILGGRN